VPPTVDTCSQGKTPPASISRDPVIKRYTFLTLSKLEPFLMEAESESASE
jgi:hypothetical protein